MVSLPCYPARLRALLTRALWLAGGSLLSPGHAAPLWLAGPVRYGAAAGLGSVLALALCFTIAAVEADGVGGGEKVV